MNKEFIDIVSIIDNYLTLKDIYKEYNKENLYDVFTIFINEVFELNDIICHVENKIDRMCIHGCPEEYSVKQIMYENEENLVNEIADVLLTTARLIQEFNLQEPIAEMIEYKYERQVGRELKRIKKC